MKISKKGIILLVLTCCGFVFLLAYYGKNADQALPQPSNLMHLSKEGEATKRIYAKTITATNQKDISKYVSYLVPKARKNTTKALSQFFEKQTVRNTLLSYRVLKSAKGHLLAEAKVKSINQSGTQKKYRDNITTMNISYVKSHGKWLIDLTTATNTQLLK